MQSKLHNAMFDLLSYKYLEANWDGYDAVKPKPEHIVSAWKLLGSLVKNDIHINNVMIAADSEISFYWKEKGGFYVEMECYPKDGKFFLSWIVDIKDKKKYSFEKDWGEDVPLEDFNKTKVFNFLKRYQPPLGESLKQFDLYHFNLFFRKESSQID